MKYRRARGLCYKCGMKWNPGHKCANSVSLHVVEELWQMLQGDEETQENPSKNDDDSGELT